MAKSISQTVKLTRTIFDYFKPFRLLFLVCVLVFATQNFIINFFLALLQKEIVQSIIQKDITYFIFNSVYILLGLAAYLLLFALAAYGVFIVTLKAEGNIRGDMLSKFLHQPIQIKHEEQLSRFVNDIPLSLAGVDAIAGYLLLGITFLGSIIVICSINWMLALAALIIGLAMNLCSYLFAKPLGKFADDIQAEVAEGGRLTLDNIAHAIVVRLFGLEEIKAEEFKNSVYRLYNASMKMAKLNTQRSAVNVLWHWFAYVGIFCFGIFLVTKQQITLPNLVLAVSVSGSVTGSLGSIGSIFAGLQRSVSAMELVDTYANFEEENLNTTLVTNFDYTAPVLTIKDLKFKYDLDAAEDAIDIAFLEIPRNMKIALVGHSGSGKSTVLNLILSLLKSADGEIALFGVNQSQANITAWRKQFAYVAQGAPLFNATIFENISYGDVAANESQIYAALQSASLSEFTDTLDEGLHHMLAESGGNISGGQRQRIAIARALLKNAAVLVMDEPSSALDPENKTNIWNMICELTQLKTVLFTTHDMADLQYADYVYFIEHGKIIEQGIPQDIANMPNMMKMLSLQE